MRWFPRFALMRLTTCCPFDKSSSDAFGYGLSISWFGLVIELGVARVDSGGLAR